MKVSAVMIMKLKLFTFRDIAARLFNSLVRSLCRDPLIVVYSDFVSVPSNTARGKARHNLFESLISVLPVTMWVLPGQNC